jgi:hypothetical protein
VILTLNPFARTPEPQDPVGPETVLQNHASELYNEGQFEIALEVALKAVQIARTVPTLLNLSIIYEAFGRFDEALPCAAEAFSLAPGDKRAAGHYGRSLLRMGDLARGWPLYLQDVNLRSQLKDFIPEWTDQDLQGKRLLVVEGEGFGDNIYFMRWMDALRKMGGQIDYICQPSLAPLIQAIGFKPLENWGGNCDFKFTDYDYHTSILTIPNKLGVTYENYKWSGPYINVSPLPLRYLRQWSKESGEPLRVGICALAGEGMSPTKQRSMHASQLQHVLNSMDRKHHWVNLTYKHELPVENPLIENWLGTAKAIATCDLVVTVDTGVCHLSAAMGVSTNLVLPGNSAWHWGLQDSHPFYPSIRMFRNYGKGMDNAVENVSDFLSTL